MTIEINGMAHVILTVSRFGVAREFYRVHGYAEVARVPRMYRGVEDGVRIAKDLWTGAKA